LESASAAYLKFLHRKRQKPVQELQIERRHWN
jgi:hypothetical protein